jgi:hypothetical protein
MDEICIMILFTTFKNSEGDARNALQEAEKNFPSEPLVHWFAKETSLDSEYNDQAAANPSGHRYIAENAYINNDADVPTVLEKVFTTLPTKKTFALWYAMNPTSRRKLPPMALSMQTDHYLAIYTIWEDEMDDKWCRSWVNDNMKEVERHSQGAYLGDSDFQVRRTRFWGDEEGKKLMEVRRKWDPEGRICGYLDEGDKSGVNGLSNIHEWKSAL